MLDAPTILIFVMAVLMAGAWILKLITLERGK